MMLGLDDFAADRAAVVCTSARLDEFGFCAWVGQAAAGDRLEYHRGFLCIDAIAETSMLPDAKRRQLNALATAARRACKAGLVDLVQMRLGPDCFAYVAVARARPENMSAPPNSLPADQKAA